MNNLKEIFTGKKIIVIVLCLVAIVAVFSVLTATSSCDYTAKEFAKAFFEDDLKTMDELMAYDYKSTIMNWYDGEEEFCEIMSESLNADIKNWNDFCKVTHDEMKISIEDEYGKYKIESVVIKSKDLSIEDLENEVECDFYEEYGFDINSVKEVKYVSTSTRINGEYDNENDQLDLYMVKTGSKWKVIDWRVS